MAYMVTVEPHPSGTININIALQPQYQPRNNSNIGVQGIPWHPQSDAAHPGLLAPGAGLKPNSSTAKPGHPDGASGQL
eukprot:11004198-Karenia_brevis.AAC.1